MNNILAVLAFITVAGFMFRSHRATTKGKKALCCITAFIALMLGESILVEHSIVPWVIMIAIVLVHGINKAATVSEYPDNGSRPIAGVMVLTLLVSFSVYGFDKYLADVIMLCGLFIYMVTLATRDLVLNMRKTRIPIK